MTFPTPKGKLATGILLRHPTANLGPALANATWNFFTTGTSTPANIYQDGALNTPFAPTGVVSADANGRFPAIYLDTAVVYKAQLKNSLGTVLRTRDPYQGSLSSFGTSVKQAFGVTLNAQNEVTLTETTGGTGTELTIVATPPGGICVQVSASAPGAVPIIINTSAATGTTTPQFAASNKPGNVSAQVALTVAPTGATYTGGTLTSNWPYATGSAYTVTLSTGQTISSCTFTNGSTTFTCPSTNITGTPSAIMSVNAGTGPVVWVPITLDGVTYYMPMWRGDLFIPIKPAPTVVGETIIGGGLIGGSVATFNPDGTTTVTNGGTATPSSWYLPTTSSIGSSYYIKVTQTSGALAFSAATSWTNISSSGLSIGTTHGLTTQAAIGTYQLSSSSVGAIIAATGSINLPGDINPTNTQTITGGNAVTFNGDGTTSVPGGSASPSNWYSPTTSNVGANYWVQVTKTSGALNFNAATGAMTNITNGGLTIGTTNGLTTAQVIGTYAMSWNNGAVATGSGTITLQGNGVAPNYSGTENWVVGNDGTVTLNGVSQANWFVPTTSGIGSSYWISLSQTSGSSGVGFNQSTAYFSLSSGIAYNINNYLTNVSATGTYKLSTSSSGSPTVGTGTVTIQGNGSGPTWNGNVTLIFNSDGTTVLNGSATTNWYSNTTTGIGASYWINCTKTSGTTGSAMTAGQGAWTSLNGLTIDLTGVPVGTFNWGGTYQISSSVTGSPVVGSGSITLTKNIASVIHVYTSGSGTETILANATTVQMEIWGSGGGGGGRVGSVCSGIQGSGGGAGGYARSSYAVSSLGGSGSTFNYSVPAGGGGGAFSGNGTAGSAGTITAGTVTGFAAMTGNGGGAGAAGGGAAGGGGAASGGNQANTTGASGAAPGNGGAGTAGTISGDGSPYGKGGNGGLAGAGAGQSGFAGAAVFYYT